MPDFRIWARVEHIGPSEFFVVASAVRAHDFASADVLTRNAASRDAATAARDELMVEIGAAVRARGDRVVVEEED